MKNMIVTIVAAAGMAAIANADTSRLEFQVSTDGVSWSSSTNALPGSVVQIRARMSYIGTEATPIAFASLTYQPTVSNWTAGDSLRPFANQGNNTNGGSVADTPGMDAPYGRISPFASTGPTSSDPYMGHVQNAGGTNYLRIARTTITNWVGQGPTTGTGAANNFNGAGGLATVQKGSGNVGPNDPPFRTGISDIVILKFAVQLSAATDIRTLLVSAPLEGMSRNATTGVREAAWFTSTSDNFGGIKAAVEVSDASINVVPAPGALALMGLGGLAVARRRR
ncbi:MAG: PEP-CTERM sorting domain-containing protein [Phycisphaeraceae bacterium]|nr:PEP-CTERM sorting domain-containing protein [Phycisphaeraceae bacterium]